MPLGHDRAGHDQDHGKELLRGDRLPDARRVWQCRDWNDRLDRGASNERLVANLTTAFSAVALLLACLGLYGTISYGVTRRVTELGVRMALGAARRDVLLLVIREASVLVLIGALIGIPLAILASRGVKSLLYGVGSSDPMSYLVAAAALIGVSAFAAFLPAHRASRIDPMVALRKD